MYNLIWLLIVLLVLFVVALVLAERFFAARNPRHPRHMARSNIPAQPAQSHESYQPRLVSKPITQLKSLDDEPSTDSLAMTTVHPRYVREDAQRRR